MARSPDDRRVALARGAEAEELVALRYEAEGFRVLARNLRIGGAELDLVVADGARLRFVEVKAREPGDETAWEQITADKQRRLAAGARAFLQAYEDAVDEATFDVVWVWLGDEPRLERVEHAFDAPTG